MALFFSGVSPSARNGNRNQCQSSPFTHSRNNGSLRLESASNSARDCQAESRPHARLARRPRRRVAVRLASRS